MKVLITVLLLSVYIVNFCNSSEIISLYETNTTQPVHTPEWAKEISSFPKDPITVGYNFTTLTLTYGPSDWGTIIGNVAFPTTNLCDLNKDDIPKYLTSGDVLIVPKFSGCSRQAMARTIATYAPNIKALLHFDLDGGFGFSQPFTDGSSTHDIHVVCLLIPKDSAAGLIVALENNYVIQVSLHSDKPTWNTLSKEDYLIFQLNMLAISAAVMFFALYRLIGKVIFFKEQFITVVYKNVQRKMTLFNISVFVIVVELISNTVRTVLFATQPLLSASGGLGHLSYPAWRVLITFTFPLICMSSTALTLYWHDLLLAQMSGPTSKYKLAFMADKKSKIAFAFISICTFIANTVTTALDAAAYDVPFYIVLAICIGYMVIIALLTYYVGYKVLRSTKLALIRNITKKMVLAVSWIWVVVVGAALHMTPAYWSVPNQAIFMAILFVGLFGLSVSNLIVFKHNSSHNTSTRGSFRNYSTITTNN